MIKHIVMWRLKDLAEGVTKAENGVKIKEMLEGLIGVIPEIKSLEVGFNVMESPAGFDIVLYSEFESLEALSAYQVHPEHEKCRDFIVEVVSDRAVVDYEV